MSIGRCEVNVDVHTDNEIDVCRVSEGNAEFIVSFSGLNMRAHGGDFRVMAKKILDEVPEELETPINNG